MAVTNIQATRGEVTGDAFGGGETRRRSVLAGALALTACGRSQATSLHPPTVAPPLRSVAPFPIGTCVQTSHLTDPGWVKLALAQCSQLTPEWEMKMEYIVQPDGKLQFDRPDMLTAFARKHDLRLYGTTLVWYSQKPDYFQGLEGRAFAEAFDRYLTAVVGRYRGQVVGWDTVNEAVAEDGEGWRSSIWSERLGDFDHMRRAFDLAHAADPGATLFINDYNLESIPKKLDTFQRLVEKLLASGAPLGGLGCQTHVWATLQPGKIREAIEALGRFGLPVQITELDVSITRGARLFKSRKDLTDLQARVYAEVVEAFGDLPAKQRFALTLWGLRDKDSWLVAENADDAPAAFDDVQRAKPAAAAMVAALREVKT